MKHFPVIILLTVAALVTMVMGCDSTPGYDGRLTAADALMHDDPDSALAIVEAVNPDELATEGDRAYRELLLTQARYRCYITASNDSDINRALAYYRAHSREREKLTRAYIYKGAVMEELGHPDSAMLYYKQAEATATSDDYFNLGYTKMRIGALYTNNYSMDGRQIRKYEEALESFNHTDNQHYQLVCLINLGSLYCLKFPQKADSVLNKALILAEQLGDTVNYIGAAQNLIKNNLNQERNQAAYQVIQDVLSKNITQFSISFCLYAATTYASLHKPDSAWLFMNVVKDVPIINKTDKLTYLETMREISLASGDTINYVRFENMSRRLNDSLCSSEKTTLILNTEDQIDGQSANEAKQSRHIFARWLKILVLLGIIVTVVTSVIIIKRRKAYRNQIDNLMCALETSDIQMTEMRQSLQNLKMLKIKDGKLKDFINSYLKLTQDAIEECYHQPSHKQVQRVKDVIKFQNSNKETWIRLFAYIDLEYNDLISKTKVNYPKLNDKDLLLIAMIALGFSYIQMATILGYNNSSTISSIKIRLAKKMGLDCSLNDYISRFNSN